MKSNVSLLSVLILFSACGNIESSLSQSSTLCVSLKEFPEDAQKVTQEVMRDLLVRIDNIETFNCSREERSAVFAFSDLEEGVLGKTICQIDVNQCRILIDKRFEGNRNADLEARFRTVLRHEMGHAFGLKHIDLRDEIMYPQQFRVHANENAISFWAKQVFDLTPIKNDRE